MKVQELIKILEQVENKGLDVIVRSTDPTDLATCHIVSIFRYAGVDKVVLGGKETEVFVIEGGSV